VSTLVGVLVAVVTWPFWLAIVALGVVLVLGTIWLGHR
jgi:hypothetical protein